MTSVENKQNDWRYLAYREHENGNFDTAIDAYHKALALEPMGSGCITV